MTATQENVTESPESAPGLVVTRSARSAQYVAYEKERRRAADPDGSGPITARSEVFIQEYPSIRVKAVNESSTAGNGGQSFETLNVRFDASSAGLSHDFSANTHPKTDTGEFLIWAHKNNVPVYLAIETRRRVKSKDEREEINPLASIRSLRVPDGQQKANAEWTNNHTVKVIAAVGRPAPDVQDDAKDPIRISRETTSDPAEWALLRDNKNGTLPPTGWSHLTSTGDPAIGAITEQTTTRTQDPGATMNRVDEPAFRDLVATVTAMSEALTRAGVTSPQAPPDKQHQTDRRRAVATEGRPYELTNSDGRVNMSSYAAVSIRCTRQSAARLLIDVLNPADGDAPTLPDGFDPEKVTWTITGALLSAADDVQEHGTGGLRNRMHGSYKEAGRWIDGVISEVAPFTANELLDSAALEAWIDVVQQKASERMHAAGLALAVYAQVPPTTPIYPTHPHADAAPDEASEQIIAPVVQTPPRASLPLAGPAPAEPQAESAAEPAHEPADTEAATVTLSGNAADNPHVIDAWNNLLEANGVADKPQTFHSLLTVQFGAWMMSEIPAEKFLTKINQWASDSALFRDEAMTAYQSARANTATGAAE